MTVTLWEVGWVFDDDAEGEYRCFEDESLKTGNSYQVTGERRLRARQKAKTGNREKIISCPEVTLGRLVKISKGTSAFHL